MKTAIQQLHYMLTEWEQPENISKESLKSVVLALYSVEKNVMIKFVEDYIKNKTGISIEDYYNQTYNQNK